MNNRYCTMFSMLFVLIFCFFLFYSWDAEIWIYCKLLAVLIHEFSHAISSLIYGAHIQNIQINLQESGTTQIQNLKTPISFFITVSSGYIGTALTASLLLMRGFAHSFERSTTLIFSILLIYMSILFTEWNSLTCYLGLGWATLGILCLVFSQFSARIFLLLVGSICVSYSLYDLFDFKSMDSSSDLNIMLAYLLENNLIVDKQKSAYGIRTLWITCTLVIVSIPFLLTTKATKATNPTTLESQNTNDKNAKPTENTENTENAENTQNNENAENTEVSSSTKNST